MTAGVSRRREQKETPLQKSNTTNQEHKGQLKKHSLCFTTEKSPKPSQKMSLLCAVT